MQIKQKKRINVSLYVIIPLIFSGISIISILVTYRLITYEHQVSPVELSQIIIWAASLGAVTFVVAFLILWTILRPVEEFVQKAESLNLLPSPSENEKVTKTRQRDEVQRYSDVLSQVTNILSKVEARELFPGIIGQSRSMREIFGQIVKVAPTESTVMISGESGTGKELVATAIFEHSKRCDKPFIAINCVAIPEGLLESELFGHEKGSFTGAIAQKKGKFELADGGTVFLDEIGDMPLATQAKLLRVLQERVFERVGGTRPIGVDVRFITATNKDLREMVKEGTFREDLFYRVNVFSIWLPALRERKEDIPVLVDHFLSGKEKTKRVTPEAMNILLGYSWPGNVRELRNVIERAAVIAENDIETMHLPPEVRGESRIQIRQECSGTEGSTLDDRLSEIEKGMIIEAITRAGGVQVRAAEILGINQRSLWHRIRKYGIDTVAIKKATKFVD